MRYKLGELISKSEVRNIDSIYGITDVRGISNNKEIQPTKADVVGRNFDRFRIVDIEEFVFNRRTTRMGEKIGLGFNNTESPFIVTDDYVVFNIIDKTIVNPTYLYMFFNRSEFDRYSRFDSWGSATEFFNWEEMCDVKIDLPPLEIQEKYVAVYKSMLDNQKAYETGLEDLKLVCDAELDIFKISCPFEPAKNLFYEIDKRNSDNKLSEVLGININKEFMPSKAASEKLDRYKIIEKNQFAYSSMQTGRDEAIRIALYSQDTPSLVSPAYSVLETNSLVLPEYIMMWFSRTEMDRYGWFLSDSSIRANLDLKRFYEIEIPIPSLQSQQCIVDIYNAYITRKKINEKLKQQIKDICPILIAGAIKESNANG